MGRNGITYPEVMRACNSILQKGKQPTVDLVRENLGTGSRSTLAKLLKEWKENNEKKVLESQTGLPQDLVESIKSLRMQIQEKAFIEIEKSKQENKILLDEQTYLTQKINEEINLLSLKNEQLNDDLLNTKKENIQIKKQCNLLSDQINSLQTEIVLLKNKLEQKKSKILDLENYLGKLQDNFEHYQKSSAQQKEADNNQLKNILAHHEKQMELLKNDSNILINIRIELENNLSNLFHKNQKTEKENSYLKLEIEKNEGIISKNELEKTSAIHSFKSLENNLNSTIKNLLKEKNEMVEKFIFSSNEKEQLSLKTKQLIEKDTHSQKMIEYLKEQNLLLIQNKYVLIHDLE